MIVLPLGGLSPGLPATAALWCAIGVGTSLIMTPSGLLIRRSCHGVDRPALFAAQFAWSHACWLIAYPAAGWLGSVIGLADTFLVHTVGVALGLVTAIFVWPAHDPEAIEHEHTEISHSHGGWDEAHHSAGVLSVGGLSSRQDEGHRFSAKAASVICSI